MTAEDATDVRVRALAEALVTWMADMPPAEQAFLHAIISRGAAEPSDDVQGFILMPSLLMNELQNTERELVDALQSQHRNMQTFWESYAGFRDATFRANERVMGTH